jgi:hypothetical protein
MFSSMFSLPQGEHEAEGSTDDSPIFLQGETVSEFRNFLWVLYALYAFPILGNTSTELRRHATDHPRSQKLSIRRSTSSG